MRKRGEMGELHVPGRLRRGARRDEQESIDSVPWLVEHMCEHLGIPDLAETEVLDVGCGVKFTQAFLGRGIPVKRYVGVDVYREMIDFLRSTVEDPRFEYHHLNAHNELYNPDGEVLTADTPWPIDGETFDLVCLFSVFTHLAPHDYVTMLRILRRYARSSTRLFFTLYIDERTEGGHGLMDRWYAILDALPEDQLSARLEAQPELLQPRPFQDLDPRKPLKWAVYSEKYARELMVGTGWQPLELCPPDEYIQHHFVCAPT